MATSISDQPSQLETAGSGYSKTSRRQYQSCDQCRKSRRACDAATLRVVNFPLGDDESSQLQDYLVDACSNCARTSKKCTFEWLRTLPKQSLPKGIKRKLGLNESPPPPTAHSTSTVSEPGYHSHYQNPASNTIPRPELNVPPRSRFSSSTPASDLQHTPLESKASNFPGHATNHNGSVRAFGVQYSLSQPDDDRNSQYSSVRPPEKTLNGLGGAEQRFNGNVDPPVLTRYDTSSSSSSASSDSIRFGNAGAKPHSHPSQISVTSDSEQERQRQQPPSKLARLTSRGVQETKSTSPSISHLRRASGNRQFPSNKRQIQAPLSPRQVRFADNAMKSMIATGLLRIYHDSFENSLSCWVTEKNCPYETELSDLLQQASPSSTAEEAAYRLGDNRIFSRVSRLDSEFSPLRGRPLTAYENRAASQALNAAIMAFASQWSHSSHNAFWRSKEGKSQIDAWQAKSKDGRPSGRVEDPIMSGECERMIQRTLWNEAKTAIQASGEIDSFKVILAYMIFALTQRPVDPKPNWGSAQQKSRKDSISTPNSGRGGWNESNLTDATPEQASDPAMDAALNEEWNPFYASDLEALASPPIYLETAVRNLFSWRRKVERYRRMRSKAQASDSSTPAIGSLALKDQQTFNILFWLGVMCDTTSSAISKRPLVIPDEDCAMIHESMDRLSISDAEARFGWQLGRCKDDADETQDGALWGSYLLGFKYAGPRSTPPRWPCSFEDAALILQEAIPVKVLMFRKVGQLQTLAYRRTAPRSLEKCIEEALAVYQQWNSTYGLFMIDCINAHNSLPPHVQSWYVILDGHWHYGCLLLADAIASIDREEKTMKPQRDLRFSCGIIVELRHANALAIAKIAAASLSEHAPSFRDNAEFHFACNGSAILTEPWTDILVRAMGSACKIFINWLATWDNPNDPAHDWVTIHFTYDDLRVHADTCIQGMRLLGRKSDAANFTASVFMDRLNRVSSGRRDTSADRDGRSCSTDSVAAC
ncbi:uncharacterized protein A1O9_04520 [Exophiala aquamarina CBS 119918]|uniref:Zn(2)-C6 fungal-type domain-containing protein n=1 Tax=Exophiala aquamarina CBS 119918 TaxID=1182545 RepID=A0A072PHR8_9EURO|nr:uncharacterized protein A1O9_04520 [Exophiala aquamarina CBS 119918]KEF59674.1 hypothetical protein A1O9_04520 [Exophiala aquamarina CBS 119918]